MLKPRVFPADEKPLQILSKTSGLLLYRQAEPWIWAGLSMREKFSSFASHTASCLSRRWPHKKLSSSLTPLWFSRTEPKDFPQRFMLTAYGIAISHAWKKIRQNESRKLLFRSLNQRRKGRTWGVGWCREALIGPAPTIRAFCSQEKRN